MADLTTSNQYLYKQPYVPNIQNQAAQGNVQNQGGYGDNPASLPISYDDPRLQPVKDKAKEDAKTNPVTSTLKAFLGEPINILIGTIPFLAIDKLLKKLPSGKSYDESVLGKMLNGIDKFADKWIPEFKGIKNAYQRLKPTNFLRQLIDSPPTTPRFSMARNQITITRSHILRDMLNEATEISKKDAPKHIKELESVLEIANHKSPKLEYNGIKHSYEELCEKAFTEAENLAKQGSSTKRFEILRNRAQFYKLPASGIARSGISKFLMAVHQNMTTFLTVNLGNFSKGMGAKSLFSNGMKLGGAAFMFFMGANLLGKMIKQTWDAPKGEKISTAAHSTIAELGSWLMMLPLGFALFKGIGSLKALKGGNPFSNIIKAPFRGLGKFLSIGLETPKAKKWYGKPWEYTKRFGGGVGRFALFMFVLQSYTDKGLRFISHSIFGKPEALLAKEKAEEEKGKEDDAAKTNNTLADNTNKGLITLAAKKQLDKTGKPAENTLQQQNMTLPENTNPANPMLDKYMKEHGTKINQPVGAVSVASPQNEQEIAAKTLGKKDKPGAYMPSDTRQVSPEDIQKKAKFQKALADTDRVISEAEKVLSPKENKKH